LGELGLAAGGARSIGVRPEAAASYIRGMENGTVKMDWLSGIRVMVIGHYVPGPLAAYLLRVLGAEVVKVEQDQGDYLRMMGRMGRGGDGDTSPMFRMLNAGFKSVVIPWKTADGAALLLKLLGKADVLIDGGRTGVLEKALGMAPEQISERLIYVPITAYGQVGPMAGLAGHDNNVLALGGNLSYTQEDAQGLPTVFSAPVADIFAGQMAAFGALAALMGRREARGEGLEASSGRHDKGVKLDVSMLHAGFFLNFLEVAARNGAGYAAPEAGKAWMNGGRADYRPYRTRDGRFVFFGPIEPWSLKKFLEGIGQPGLAGFPGEALAKALEGVFLSRDLGEWVEAGKQLDICLTAVNSLEEAIREPQVAALGLVQRVEDAVLGELVLPSYPMGFGKKSLQPELPAAAPRLGEHTEEVLREWLGIEK
jgi:alpha-methylacyl-CoA racemase